MRPIRMCMVCRQRRDKSELVRIVCRKGDMPQIDYSGKAPGRGMYICKSAECVSQAERRHVVERAFHIKADNALYTELLGQVGEKDE